MYICTRRKLVFNKDKFNKHNYLYYENSTCLYKKLHVSTLEDQQTRNMQHCRKASTAFIIKDNWVDYSHCCTVHFVELL